MSPNEEEALYLPFGQEGCTDGILTSLSRRQHMIKSTVFFIYINMDYSLYLVDLVLTVIQSAYQH